MDLKVDSAQGIVDTGVSVDAAWAKRGFSSLNGVTTAISVKNGKILDTEPMSKYCLACSRKELLKKTDPKTYETWNASHSCVINYSGSSGGMEAAGAKLMFERSIEKHGLQYTEFIGDGDSKSHPTVENTYKDIKVKKLECIGHVQKRVGNRLRKLKKTVKNIGGKGKLTLKMVDRLQNYYGIAIRSNTGKLQEMQKAVRASLFHVASSTKHDYHNAYCPSGPDSWCAAQRDKALNTNKYKPGAGLPIEVIAAVKPIYNDLGKTELLEKCLHGYTQNQNESFHSMIWTRVPKMTHASLKTFEFAILDAVATFNVGRKSTLDVYIYIYKIMNIDPGKYTESGCQMLNRQRISKGNLQCDADVKQRRKIKRAIHKGKLDKHEEEEPKSYDPGGF